MIWRNEKKRTNNSTSSRSLWGRVVGIVRVATVINIKGGSRRQRDARTLVYRFSLLHYLHVWYSSTWYGWNMCSAARFISNLHLRTSVWYSSNWIGTLCCAQARKSERALGRFIRDTSTSRAPHWFEIHNFWITIFTFYCFEEILKSYILYVPFLLIFNPWVVDHTFFRHQCRLILVPDWQNHGTSRSNLFNDTFGRVL